jgi:SAM-dependent methyltransferase
MSDIRRLSHASTNDTVLALVTSGDLRGRRVLDVGAGEGYFSQLLGEHLKAGGLQPAAVLRACDLFPAMFRYPDVPCDAIDAAGRLPYDDARFDIVCAVEVVEHLQDQFHFARELYRVTRPGGRTLITTPNLLNVNSRLRYLTSGFWLLFDPLSLSSHDPVHTAGHIHPVTFYYLAYLFRRAGFRDVRLHVDRRKRSAAALAVLLAPLFWWGRWRLAARLRRKQPAVYAENAALLAAQNSWALLTSRSVVLEATK